MTEIYPAPETLSAAAQTFAEQAERAVEAQGRFSVAISAEATPAMLMRCWQQSADHHPNHSWWFAFIPDGHDEVSHKKQS